MTMPREDPRPGHGPEPTRDGREPTRDAETTGPRAAAVVVDVFVYTVVLNLFVEYFPQFISETFTFSLLTAGLLKAVLEIVIAVKNRLKVRFRLAPTPAGKVVAGLLLWLVLVGSKFLVLETLHLLFGTRVKLGGFFSVTLLILALLASRAAVRRLLRIPPGASPPAGLKLSGEGG
jgi:hypothetical protein